MDSEGVSVVMEMASRDQQGGYTWVTTIVLPLFLGYLNFLVRF